MQGTIFFILISKHIYKSSQNTIVKVPYYRMDQIKIFMKSTLENLVLILNTKD